MVMVTLVESGADGMVVLDHDGGCDDGYGDTGDAGIDGGLC